MAADRLYFAYGSNLNTKQREEWCRSRGYPDGLLRAVKTAVLPDMELVFSHRSRSRGGGALNLRQRTGQVVDGVLFEVSGPGWDALDAKEGAPRVYRRRETIALTLDGAEVPATTYLVRPEHQQAFVPPRDGYVDVVSAGLKEHGLDDFMLMEAARGKSPAHRVHAIFVYGTLMRGDCRAQILERFKPQCWLLAEAPGQLVDVGAFPGMLPQVTNEQWVQGEFVQLRHIADALEQLDEIEGFRGFGDPYSLYRRALIEVGVGDGRVRLAWTYLLNRQHDDAPVIPSGDWRERRGCKDEFIEALVAAHCGDSEEAVAQRLAKDSSFPLIGGAQVAAKRLLPLAEAVRRGDVSERRLARVTGKWSVLSV